MCTTACTAAGDPLTPCTCLRRCASGRAPRAGGGRCRRRGTQALECGARRGFGGPPAPARVAWSGYAHALWHAQGGGYDLPDQPNAPVAPHRFRQPRHNRGAIAWLRGREGGGCSRHSSLKRMYKTSTLADSFARRRRASSEPCCVILSLADSNLQGNSREIYDRIDQAAVIVVKKQIAAGGAMVSGSL